MSDFLFLNGHGIHTNQNSVVQIENRLDKNPLTVCFTKVHNQFKTKGWSFFLDKPIHATYLRSKLGTLQTPEHLMAVLLGFSHCPLAVRCDGVEVLIQDGSGDVFFQAIQKKWNFQPKINQYQTNIQGKIPVPKGSFEYKPHSSFKVDYTIHQGEMEERFVFDLSDPSAIDVYQNQIIPARTFIFWDDYQKIRLQNYALGANLDSGILYVKNRSDYDYVCRKLGVLDCTFPKIEKKKKQIEMEIVKHKILDLIGDLALISLKLPKLYIRVTNAGHWQNYFLIKELINEHNRRNT